MSPRAVETPREHRPLRVALDTATLASAFTFPGSQSESAYRAGLEGRTELVTSRHQLAELGRSLHALGWDPAAVEAAIAQLLRVSRVVPTAGSEDDPAPAEPSSRP